MRTAILGMGTAVGLLLCAGELSGQDLVITSFEKPGRITWTGPSLNVTCRVEWAASPGGPWHSSWTNQQAIFVTDPSNEMEVAMCYRVVCEIPDPHFPDITAGQSLALIANRKDDPDFVVIDVRRASEYAIRHITNALNIDYYSPTFASELDALDKNKVYLIHCASGIRSGNAHDTMLGLGFHEVYNMQGGMTAFQNVPGVDAYLDP
jgi:rhodanese-related sulfurtransferase